MITRILTFSFIVATLVFFIVSLILRLLKHRRPASIFELLAAAFFVAFTSQYIVGLNYLSASTYNFEGFSRIFLFLLSVIFVIYKLFHFIRYHS